MLPQVANHILHHTTRAVAAAPAVRNVLGSGAPAPSWAGAGSSYGAGAGAGGHAGAGGSKYHAGSRFYSGYTGPGRAVTQANTSTANGTEIDDEDVRVNAPSSSRRKFRARSQSFSLGSGAHGRKSRAQSLGVLKAVQAHFRTRHAFAGPNRQLLLSAEAVDVDERPATPRLVRRNSTASTVSASTPPSPTLPPEHQSRPPSPFTLDPADAAAPQTVLPPEVDPTPVTETGRLLDEARGDHIQIRAAIDRLRAADTLSIALEWNLAIQALADMRRPKETVAEIVSVYHDMIARNLRPDMTTYTCLLEALLQRSFAVNQSIRAIRDSVARRSVIGDRVEKAVQRDFMDRQTLAALEAETNFTSAITIFRSVDRVSGWSFTWQMYTTLFHACAEHHDIDAALHVFAHMERRGMKPRPEQYAWLIRTYTDAGDFEGARVVFDELQRVRTDPTAPEDSLDTNGRRGIVMAWNETIRAHILAGNSAAALLLLEQMMDSTAGKRFGSRDVPVTAPSTYDTVVDAFCDVGDYSTAVSWFNRLNVQGQAVSDSARETPIAVIPRPKPNSAEKIILGLATHGEVDALNQFNRDMSRSNGSSRTWYTNAVVYLANIRYLLDQPPSGKIVDRLNWLHSEVISGPQTMRRASSDFLHPVDPFAPAVALYARQGAWDDLAVFVSSIFHLYTTELQTRALDYWTEVSPIVRALLFDAEGKQRHVPLLTLLYVAHSSPGVRIKSGTMIPSASTYPDELMLAIVDTFAREVKTPDDCRRLSKRDWHTVAFAIWSTSSRKRPDLVPVLLRGMDQAEVTPPEYTSFLVQTYSDANGVVDAVELVNSLGPAFAGFLPSSPHQSTSPVLPSSPDSILSSSQDRPSTAGTSVVSTQTQADSLSRSISIFLRQIVTSQRKPLESAWQLFSTRAEAGTYPDAFTLGSLIQHLGRAKMADRLFTAYDVAQRALATVNEADRLPAWGAIEENMIVGLAHAGDGQRADMHRQRMLEQGLTPSADAYAALIQAVRDTTDDTSIAMTYFDEATARGVEPNQFLFNTAISKLAKARKAEFALQLFAQMKARNIRRTPVTYGAVIGACCRVGDAATAETLFEEMLATQYRKRLRVPPFNTMMQFFVQTKPNRERVLAYYTRLRKEGILPSAHTYKLVLDAYGSIEPVDFTSMEKTFQALCKDPNVAVEGVHWASLINAYGCVGKNLDRAVATFESIATHPTTPASGLPVAGAVVYEALINVFVTLRRVDLISPYLERLRASGVHMTAYIANLLIRGHALSGDIETARAVFESMHDPPAGVAAPHNHAPHDLSLASSTVSPDAPVYREPSTWEAMVRAELGQGNRNEAVALLERLTARHYPESIYKRISGIMLDDSVSPWPATPIESIA